MRLRLKLILYLIAIHLIFGISTYFIFLNNRLWIFVIEAFYVVSFIAGFLLIRSMFKPLDLIITGAELIEEGDFTTTFSQTGQREMDRLISLYNDMVKKLRAERLSQEEQHLFLDKLIQASPSGIMILDYDGRIERINKSAEILLDLSNEDAAGSSLTGLKTALIEALDKLAPGKSDIIPLRGSRLVKCTKSQFIDSGFQRHFILMEELTEEIRASEKSAYEKLIRLLSHEVNNSVGAVSSLLQSCLHYSGQVSDTDRGDYENAVTISINRLGNLNEFMRGYADIVRLPKPNLIEGDIMKLLRDCEDLFHGECMNRQVVWEWDIREKIPPFPFDRRQMEQVFVNIIKNALEAVGSDGTVTVRAGKINGGFSVIIEDTGSGITDVVRKNLFTPFYSTKDNGQGIGLTLVQEILNRHNFEFSLERLHNNKTQFTIFLNTIWGN